MNTFQWLSRLVAFNTISEHSNLELINCIVDELKKYQITSYLTYDQHKKKANLFATLPAYDGRRTGGIVLSGHTDVVPIAGQQWDTHPFEATLIKDRFYGRGVCDMKGFLAVVLALLPEWMQMPLPKPLHLAFSFDEEIGCMGAPLLIADFIEREVMPEACIVGEPSNMSPIIAHKGIEVFRCKIKGCAAHSSLTPKGANAIEYATAFIYMLRKMADELREDGPFDNAYDVPFSTLSTNQITGGNAYNTIPETCEFIFELRYLSLCNPESLVDRISGYLKNELVPKIKKEHIEASIQLTALAKAPSFDLPQAAPFCKWVQSLCRENNKLMKVAYATDAGHFQKAGIPSIICGPGNIQEAHKANEFVLVEQLQKCEDFLREVAKTPFPDSRSMLTGS